MAHPKRSKSNPTGRPDKYVQDYIDQFGERKCEANALIINIEIGRQLCEETILKYFDPEGIERYHDATRKAHIEVRDTILSLIQERRDEFQPNGDDREDNT